MKINDYELFLVPPRWLFLKISTDAGIAGWGEPVIEGRAATVKAAVGELMEQLVGKDPLQIEDHWQAMYRGGFYRGGPILMSAIAGIDQALWDIKGKDLGVPVYELLGGRVRDTVRCYTHFGGNSPEAMAESALAKKAKGWTAIKTVPVPITNIIDGPRKLDAAEAGLPFKRPSQFPRGSLLAARIVLASEDQGWVGDFCRRVYHANFAEDRDIGQPEVINEILIDLKLDAQALRARAEAPETKQALRARTERAIELGIFGSPTWRVGNELFWGSDRVDQAVRFWQRSRG